MVKDVTRNKNGTIRNFKGGENTTWHGTLIKIGREFKRQFGRSPRVGDLVRVKNKNGSYNKGSTWKIRTKYGWRKSKTGTLKPTKTQVSEQLKRSRPGRGK